jgi:hypothetical protein
MGLNLENRLGQPPETGSASESGQRGELINGTYATYHGPIDLLTPQLNQDFDRSMDTLSDMSVSKAKLFRSPLTEHAGSSVLGLLSQFSTNISFVINQQELCENVIGANVLEDIGFKRGQPASGNSEQIISDFTLVDFRYLVILVNKTYLVVFDCQ